MTLHTKFINQIGFLLIWILIFDLDMYDDLLGVQVVQCCKRSILTGCNYSLVMG